MGAVKRLVGLVRGERRTPKSNGKSSKCSVRRSVFDIFPNSWRRGELNPCPRRGPRSHLHVYPMLKFKEPNVAPAQGRPPSVREIDSPANAVAPPAGQPAVHVFAASRRRRKNVTVN